MHLTYADLLRRRVLLTTQDAIALVIAAAHAKPGSSPGGRREPAFSPEDIVLSPCGEVSLVATGSGEELTPLPTSVLAELLKGLLSLDDRDRGQAMPAPGPLVLMMARALGEIDAPPPARDAFIGVLRRFGSGDRETLAATYRRVCGQDALQRRPWLPTRASWGLAAASVIAGVLASLLYLGRPGEMPSGATASLHDTVTTPPPSPSPPPPRTRQTPTSNAAPQVIEVLSAAAVGADVFSPSFAPDGALVFHAGRRRGALMRASFDARGIPRVATILRDDAANYHPAVSPDGQWLAFDSDRDGTRAVYLSRADGSHARRISGAGFGAVPRWSPDGRYLAFVRADSRRPRVWNVWVAEVATGDLVQVSRHRFGQAWGASWFPDSRRLAYSVEDTLAIVSLDTGERAVVRSPRAGRLVRTPAVSPDGSQIVFQVYKDGVWLLDVSTGNARRLLDDDAAEEFAWSPDGRRIVYHTRGGGAWGAAAIVVS